MTIYVISTFTSILKECDIPDLRPQLIHWSLKYQGGVRPNFLGVSCQPIRFVSVITFPTLYLALDRWMLLRKQSTVGCLPPWRRCLWGCEKCINNFVFSLRPVLQVLIIIINIIIMNESAANCNSAS